MMKPVMVRSVSIGTGRPKICVPLVAETENELYQKAKALKGGPWDLVEWRADWYGSGADPEQAVSGLSGLRAILGDRPILFTFRTKAEGGEQALAAGDYLALNRAAAESGLADLIDVELFSGLADETRLRELMERAHALGVKVVMSSHDFEKTPPSEEITARLGRMAELGADVLKAAVMPKDRRDVLELLLATEEASRRFEQPLITMAMGGLGVITRVAGETFGSAVTFGSAGTASAPGQMDVGRLRDVLDALHEGMGTVEVFPDTVGALADTVGVSSDTVGASLDTDRAKAEDHIFLIGFMGTGKSTVARALSAASGRPALEMDERVAEENGMEIRDLFDRFGEEYFRDLESLLVEKICREPAAVVSCGGGAVLRSRNVEAMKKAGTIVLLTAAPETVLGRVKGDDSRPVLKGKMNAEAIGELMEKRRAAYENAADLTVATDGRTPEEIGREILTRLQPKGGRPEGIV